jgi:predicted GTPase
MVHEELRTYDYIPVLYISAHTKQRLTKIVEMAKEIQQRRLHRSSTAFLNDALLEDIDRTPPPAIRGNSLRINYITQTNTAPPFLHFSVITPKKFLILINDFWNAVCANMFHWKAYLSPLFSAKKIEGVRSK